MYDSQQKLGSYCVYCIIMNIVLTVLRRTSWPAGATAQCWASTLTSNTFPGCPGSGHWSALYSSLYRLHLIAQYMSTRPHRRYLVTTSSHIAADTWRFIIIGYEFDHNLDVPAAKWWSVTRHSTVYQRPGRSKFPIL